MNYTKILVARILNTNGPFMLLDYGRVVSIFIMLPLRRWSHLLWRQQPNLQLSFRGRSRGEPDPADERVGTPARS